MAKLRDRLPVISRLQSAVLNSRKKLLSFREQRLHSLRQYLGKHYGENAADDKVPMNLLKLAALIYQRQLVPRNPRVMVATRHAALKPTAFDMQTWANHRIQEMDLAETLRSWVLDGLFCVGILKVGLAVYDQVEYEGWTHDVGEPFVDPIDLDDWVHDVSARRWDQVAFCGHRYRLPVEVAQSSDYFDKEARKRIGPVIRSAHNEGGDERSSVLSTGAIAHDDDELEDMTECWEIYLPRKQLVVTLAADEDGGVSSGEPLRVVEWQGPQWGPYHLLGFGTVPGQVMPTAPIQDLIDLHELANVLFRKLGRQADRQKTVLGVQGGATEDGKRIVDASDGEALRLDNPDSAREYRFGGVDSNNLMFLIQIKQLYSYLAGNLDTQGGLGPQSETLGQDQMLKASSSVQVQEMSDRVISGTRKVLRSLCWYWWHDPLANYEVEKTIPGTEFSVPGRITPEMRQANFLSLNFDIDPYSLQNETPQSRLNALLSLLGQVLMPAGPMLQQQGMAIAWENLIRKIATYANMPDLEEILQFQMPPATNQGPYNEPPRNQGAGMPSQTTRNYVRTNRPGMTSRGQDEVMMQMLAGGGQQAQRQAVGRPVG